MSDYPISTIRHSLAHIMAASVQKLFPDVKFAGGPAIENGFYYDFDTEHKFAPDDFAAIEREMRDLIKSNGAFTQKNVSPAEAKEIFAAQPYKMEWLNDYDANGDALSVYTFRDFADLCKGPHVASSKDLPRDSWKLQSIAGAYWKGDSKNKMLQRIYADAFLTAAELDAHIKLVAESAARDHRKIGPALDLFFFDSRSPGVPYYMPDGLTIYKELYNFWSIYHEERGYIEFRRPLMNRRELYETSGHWEHYKDDMFVITEDENNVFALAPMSCPNTMVAFNQKSRSYNDLPFRLSDADMLYRHESSGSLNGLFRTYEFNQDDAHIFISEDQIESEYNNILDIIEDFYKLFNMKCSIKLSTRPDDFMGDIETWNKAEDILRGILTHRFGADGFGIKEKDGAFYGPKLDIQMTDVLGREWQMGTVQLDFQLPRRFDCQYAAADGTLKTPIVIHRVVYGSLGRFIGILTEHLAGKFPVWLAPTHAVIIPITDNAREYAQSVATQLRDVEIRTATRGLRVKCDFDSESMQKKIRNAQLKQVPYMIIVGDNEMKNGTISIRTRDNKQINDVQIADFIETLRTKIKTRALDL